MTFKDTAYKIEDLHFELWQANSIAEAVRVALVEGNNSAEAYEGALYALTTMLFCLEQKSDKMMNEMFEALKEQADKE